MDRIYAWYECEVLDRPPVRFHRHNSEFETIDQNAGRWPSLRDRWFDADYQVESFEASIRGVEFLGETFPVYWPNLGPDVFASFFGMELEYGETTSWATHSLSDLESIDSLAIDWESPYLKGIDALTDAALARCRNQFLVGYTDLHPGVDCAAALRGSSSLCIDLYDQPERVEALMEVAVREFRPIYDHFHAKLKAYRQPSVSWMQIPSYGTMHIPSADFSSLISTAQFERFCIPVHEQEIRSIDHNIFHVDGPGVARHLDLLLELDGIHAFQWVQGVGDDYPIMQWAETIRKIRGRNRPIIVDLSADDLNEFMETFSPEGVFLWVDVADTESQRAVLDRVTRWVSRA